MEVFIVILDYKTKTVTLKYDFEVNFLDYLPELFRLMAEEFVKEIEETNIQYSTLQQRLLLLKMKTAQQQ